jgi:Orsellinic acid/F9775 biosynthesis cluster protein D
MTSQEQDNSVTISQDKGTPPRLDPKAVIRYDETWQVAVCKSCGIGVHGNTLQRHLMESKHRFRKTDWGPILNALRGCPQPMSKEGFPRPPHGIPPIPDLKIWDGFTCNLCQYIITSKQVMHRHLSKVHKIIAGDRNRAPYDSVKVQVHSICRPRLIYRHGLAASVHISGLSLFLMTVIWQALLCFLIHNPHRHPGGTLLKRKLNDLKSKRLRLGHIQVTMRKTIRRHGLLATSGITGLRERTSEYNPTFHDYIILREAHWFDSTINVKESRSGWTDLN